MMWLMWDKCSVALIHLMYTTNKILADCLELTNRFFNNEKTLKLETASQVAYTE